MNVYKLGSTFSSGRRIRVRHTGKWRTLKATLLDWIDHEAYLKRVHNWKRFISLSMEIYNNVTLFRKNSQEGGGGDKNYHSFVTDPGRIVNHTECEWPITIFES